MAVYTKLSLADADRLSRAHGLGAARAVVGIEAGSVNSNFVVTTEARPVFVRVYEEQGVDGVAYEWALLAHLAARGLPVPRRVPGPPPGALRVADKPTACFELAGGEELCQARVDAARVTRVGRLLARAHRASSDFPIRREGRFTRADVRARLDGIARLARPALTAAVARLSEALDEVDAAWDPTLPSGVIHGDLFRDNVRWEGPEIALALDWESASDGLFVYDLAVTTLAWCYGDALSWELVAALVGGYEAARPLADPERAFFRVALEAAAVRFTVTRITDFHLRAEGAQKKKDWRRFLARLEAVRAAPDPFACMRG